MKNINHYFDRIGYTGSTDPTLATLKALHRAHLMAVPFENLSISLGEKINLEIDWLFDKIVKRQRGGFCYEQNGLLAWALAELGFRVSMLNARVHNGEGVYGIEFDHMTLRVELDEPYLADVGFGEFIHEPLRWIEGLEQVQQPGTYRLMRQGEVWRTETLRPDGTWWTDYIFTLRPHTLADFAPGCVYQQTSPDSIFTQKRVCTLPAPDGRLTLRDDRLIITRNGQKEEQPIADEVEYRRLLKEYFGIDLPSSI